MCNTLQVSAKCEHFPHKVCITAQFMVPVALVAVQNHRAASDHLLMYDSLSTYIFSRPYTPPGRTSGEQNKRVSLKNIFLMFACMRIIIS